MTDEKPRGKPWYGRPAVMLPLIAATLVVSTLVAPARREGDPRATTLSADPPGARLFYETAERLGWKVERSMTRTLPPDPGTVYVLLAPPVGLRGTEVNALLEHVRSGGGLLVAVQAGAHLFADSLGVRTRGFGFVDETALERRTCVPEQPLNPGTTGRRGVPLLAFDWDTAAVWRADTLLRIQMVRPRQPAIPAPTILAGSLGSGRIVLSADVDLWRNDAMRVCRNGFDVAAVRALEWLRAGGTVPRTRVVFAEYYQGHGSRPGSLAAILAYFARTPSGHVLFQLVAAGLLLLFATAPRTAPPTEATRVERRSPLEHVDALARAYAQVGATRTAARHMVLGLRRRVEQRIHPDRGADATDAFLQRVEGRHPSLQDDIELVRSALADSGTPASLSAAAQAVRRIETTLATT